MPGYDTLVEKLRGSGLKMTPQRLAILRHLADNERHPTAQDVYESLVAEQPTLSFATVYNSLAALAEAGVCSRLELSGSALRFDPNIALHDHALCDRCGAVQDVRAAAEAALPRHPRVAGFRVRAVERTYRGLCPACQKQRPPR